MGARRRKSKKRSSTSTPSEKQLKRNTFFLERSLGGTLVLEELRKAGLKVEPHQARFRHNTPDTEWLAVVGEKKWIVLMRDQKIGHRPLELEALLQAGVRSFVLVEGQLPDRENAKILIKAIPRMFEMIREYRFPFIARVRRDGSISLWKTSEELPKGRKKQTTRAG
jgi:PIN like domain